MLVSVLLHHQIDYWLLLLRVTSHIKLWRKKKINLWSNIWQNLNLKINIKMIIAMKKLVRKSITPSSTLFFKKKTILYQNVCILLWNPKSLETFFKSTYFSLNVIDWKFLLMTEIWKLADLNQIINHLHVPHNFQLF